MGNPEMIHLDEKRALGASVKRICCKQAITLKTPG